MKKTGIVTVLYNSAGVIEDFIESLAKQSEQDFRLYLIDNASPDSSVERAEAALKKYPMSYRLLRNPGNTGVAAANNRGIRTALAEGCRFILLSNNDITMEEGAIGALLSALSLPDTEIAVPKIFFHGSDRLWYAGGTFCPFSGSTRHFGYRKKDREPFSTGRKVRYAPSCFLLIRAAVFRHIGEMDEKYFLYYDDTDFLWRAEKAGLTTRYEPKAVVHHKVSHCTGGTHHGPGDFLMNRNVIYFSLKNHRPFHTALVFIYHSLRILRRLLLGRVDQAKEMARACREGFELYYRR